MAAHQALHPWDSPGKNTGVGCHFLLQCMKVKSESDVTQSCPTPSLPMDCSLPGSSVHGIFQARVLEWVAIALSGLYYTVVGFAIHWHESAIGDSCTHGCTCVPHPEYPSNLPPHSIPQGHPSALALSTLSHALNLDWQSISHMVVYIFQCYSLKSSHPRLFPQSPKVCSLHLCLLLYHI